MPAPAPVPAPGLCRVSGDVGTRAAGFEAQPRAVRAGGPFFAALLGVADEIDARVIVVGSRGRSSVAAAVLGSVSTGILHHTRRPVLVVRDES